MIVLLVACGLLPLPRETSLTVVNDGPAITPDFRVTACDFEVWAGRLEPGAQETVPFRPQGDCSFDVELSDAGGRPVPTRNLGYTTPNDEQAHAIHVEGTRARYTVVGEPLPPLVNRVQAILDHPAVVPFLHPEVPANAPLQVAVPPELVAEARDARVAGELVAQTPTPHVVLAWRGDRLTLQIPAEGVVGTVRTRGPRGSWELAGIEVAER